MFAEIIWNAGKDLRNWDYNLSKPFDWRFHEENSSKSNPRHAFLIKHLTNEQLTVKKSAIAKGEGTKFRVGKTFFCTCLHLDMLHAIVTENECMSYQASYCLYYQHSVLNNPSQNQKTPKLTTHSITNSWREIRLYNVNGTQTVCFGSDLGRNYPIIGHFSSVQT